MNIKDLDKWEEIKKEFYKKFVTWRMYDLKNFKDNKIVFKNINKDIKKNYDNQWKWFEKFLSHPSDKLKVKPGK